MASRPLSVLLLTMLLVLFIISSAGRPQVAAAVPGEISTYAGGGVGDGGGAASAAVSPYGMAADGAGNLYIADSTNCRVRKLTPGGAVSTVAGMGICGFSGDAGPATSARLAYPQAVAVTASGVLYIADAGNCRVRKVDAGGIITTFAGTGLCIYGGDGGAPASAFLAQPSGVAVASSGDVYIADSDNCRVRKVSGGTITTFAGTGACGFSGDGALATAASISHATGVWEDGAGNVYIADTDVCRVRVVTPSGNISTVAGNGTCGYASDGGTAYGTAINKPRAITTDASGDLYIVDTENCRVRKVDYPAVTISTVAGDGTCSYGGDGGPATSAKIKNPRGIAIFGADVYIGDSDNCRVRVVVGAAITTALGTGSCRFGGDGGPATNATLFNPGEVAVDTAGSLYIADTGNCRVRKVTSAGVMSTFAGNGACAFSGDGGPATSAALNGPRGVAVDTSGNVYIADSSNCRIRKVSPAGVITTSAGVGLCAYGGDGGPSTSASLTYPQGVAVFGSTVYVADTFSCRIRKIVAGTITTVAGDGSCAYDGDGGSPLLGSLTFPYAVAADANGVYIVDTFNCRVRKVAGGTISTIAGTGTCGFAGDSGLATSASINHPTGITVGANSSVYIADTDNCRVRLISAATILTLAGTGSGVASFGCDFGGDGGSATNSQIDLPSSVAVDGAGNVFISDAANGRIRRVAGGHDADSDGVSDAADNCAIIANASQLNSDRNYIDLPPSIPFDDLTRPNSDAAGDGCDTDDDNDGLTDAAEAGGCNGSGSLSTTNPDSDADRFLDNAECILGSNPASAASIPAHIVSPDADNDGVPDAHDPNDASNDSDGDGVLDRVEFRFYATNLAGSNTDGDVCSDGREIASVNGDTTVNIADLGLTASHYGSSATPNYLVQFDNNKDGTINIADMGFLASKYGTCP